MQMINTQEKISPERWGVAAGIVTLAALIIAVAGVAFGVPLPVGLLLVLIAGLIWCGWIARCLPREWDGLHRSHIGWSILLAAVGIAAVARTAGVAWFMANPTHTRAAMYWFDHFYTAHSCYSGYWRAAELARAGAQNLYDTAQYNGWMGRFQIDEFLYVPQFLILPRLALALFGDFYKMRAAWFALEAASLATATLVLCRWIGGAAGRRAALLVPALWVSSPILATLQVGNYQLAAIALALIAMVSFERNRSALGGALLAVAGFKLYPGLLCVYLAATRRWRALGWTIAFSLLYCVAAYLWMGGHPFGAFVHYTWPRIVSGDAWPFLDDPDVSAINDSVPGLVLKLKILGVKGMTHSLEDTVAWAWTALVVVLAAMTGYCSPRFSRVERTCCWLALLTLASFRVRFTPDIYGLIAPLLLWTFIAASTRLTWPNKIWLAIAWIALNAVLPFSGIPLVGNYRLLVSTASQLIAIGLCFFVLLGYLRRSTQVISQI
jgi:Glycosyltransferase family 87